MKREIAIVVAAILLMVASPTVPIVAQETGKAAPLFSSCLHHTAGGMAYWYAKEHGGLETVTGVPYSELGCKSCHVETCDECHAAEKAGKPAYSTAVARDQTRCLKCHGREAAIMKLDKAEDHEDVHLLAGLQCMDCHTAADVHGDGTSRASMKEPGALGPTCEGCHKELGQTASHTVHGAKLDCTACHVRQVVSCTNCHFETLVKTGKRVAIPVSGWVFLMSYGGKVASANMQSFVAPGNTTFLMFAPQFSHSVMKIGRSCRECHATEAARQAGSGTVRLQWVEGNEVRHASGAIPVAAGAKYEVVFQNHNEGQWSVIENPPEPPIHLAGFGSPLSEVQLEKLAKVQGER